MAFDWRALVYPSPRLSAEEGRSRCNDCRQAQKARQSILLRLRVAGRCLLRRCVISYLGPRLRAEIAQSLSSARSDPETKPAPAGGIGFMGYFRAGSYRREIVIPDCNRRMMLHCGGSDFEAAI